MAIILKSVQEFWKIKRGKLLKKVKIFLTIIIIIIKFWLTFKIVSKVQWSSLQKDKF